MAKDSNKLTALGIKSLGTGKHYDGGGLLLRVEATGRKYWRYDFRIAGKPDTFAVGVYPKVTLAEARLRHAEASALVRQGINPKAHK